VSEQDIGNFEDSSRSAATQRTPNDGSTQILITKLKGIAVYLDVSSMVNFSISLDTSDIQSNEKELMPELNHF
jgi:hypothetical protein